MADESWIEGAELSARATEIFGSAKQLKEWLLVRLSTGRVIARAKSCLIHKSGSDPAERIADWDIPPKAWSFISIAYDGPYEIELSDDLQFMSGPTFPPGSGALIYALRKFECSGISYGRHDLNALLGPVPPNPAGAVKLRGSGGRQPDKQKWSQFAAAFAVIAAKDGIDSRADAAAIYEQIVGFLALEDMESFVLENVRDAITMAQVWSSGGKLKA